MTTDNTANQNKNPPGIVVTESEEYRALFSQKQILQERIFELEEILKKDIQTNPAIGFQKATDLVEQQPESNEKATTTTHINFPANLLAKFFIASRNVKQNMKLTINDSAIVDGWIVE